MHNNSSGLIAYNSKSDQKLGVETFGMRRNGYGRQSDSHLAVSQYWNAEWEGAYKHDCTHCCCAGMNGFARLTTRGRILLLLVTTWLLVLLCQGFYVNYEVVVRFS